jgi:hypothetical protein
MKTVLLILWSGKPRGIGSRNIGKVSGLKNTCIGTQNIEIVRGVDFFWTLSDGLNSFI